MDRFDTMGIDEDVALHLIKDYSSWKKRPEICGPNNIEEGANLERDADDPIDMTYGVYGEAASWYVGGLEMEVGAGQMNTVFSWGTLKEAGIISNCGTAIIE